MDFIYVINTLSNFGGIGPIAPPSTADPTVWAAFLAGVLSFFSPCVLPLIPGYLSFISGVSIDKLHSGEDRKSVLLKTISTSLVFILGFSTVFIMLGATATTIGSALKTYQDTISKVLSVIILIFGLHFIGVYRLKFLAFEKKVHASAKPLNYLSVYLLGLAFAFGWTPCVGPILASILAVAATKGQVTQGIVLLSSYSLGLAIPFFLTAVAMNSLLGVFTWIKKHFRIIEIISGLLLITVAVLMFFGVLEKLSQSLI